MLSKQCLSVVLFVTANLVPKVFSVAIPEALTNGVNLYVELDPTKEYSDLDLEKLWKQQETKQQPEFTYRPDRWIPGDGPNDPPRIIRPKVIPPSPQHPLNSARTSVTIDSTCPKYGDDSLKFLATTKYDGKDVTFQRIGNIDSVGPVTITRDGSYIKGEAQIFHSACRNYKDGTTCSYHYVATITADITAAERENGISIGSYPPLWPNNAKRPVVFQSCKPRVRGDRKPCPQISGTTCHVGLVTVWT